MKHLEKNNLLNYEKKNSQSCKPPYTSKLICFVRDIWSNQMLIAKSS